MTVFDRSIALLEMSQAFYLFPESPSSAVQVLTNIDRSQIKLRAPGLFGQLASHLDDFPYTDLYFFRKTKHSENKSILLPPHSLFGISITNMENSLLVPGKILSITQSPFAIKYSLIEDQMGFLLKSRQNEKIEWCKT